MPTFIKTGFWETLCQKCTGYKGWLNLDKLIESKIPQPTYKVYTALLTQNLDQPPVANILENTLGDIVWTYYSGGIFYGTLTGAFTNKTFLQGNFGSSGRIFGVPAYNDDLTDVGTFVMITKEDSNTIRITTLAYPEILANGILQNFPIEIRVYN